MERYYLDPSHSWMVIKMDELEKFKQECKELKRYLRLADVREFTYDVENDILENFRYGEERETFFKGTLSQWEEDYRSNRMDRGGEGNVSSFCDALRKGKPNFDISFSFKGLTRIIRGVTVEENGRKIVYGVLMMGNTKAAPAEITYKRASDKDVMLNMLNKKAIMECAERRCAKNDGEVTYLVFFDLDNFKIVNDTYGHLYGDEVLVTVTEIINRAVGSQGFVGRIGGDEILLVMKDIKDKAELRPILRQIRSTVEETYKGRMKDIALTCSMGAAAYPLHGNSCKEVMELADKMLYLAKEKGKNRYLIYTPEMHQDIVMAQENAQAEKHDFSVAFNKIGIIQYMMDDYLKKGTSSNERSFAMVGESFKLSEILIIYESGKVGFHWTQEGMHAEKEELGWVSLDEKFYSLFDENKLLIIDGLYDLTNKNPDLEKKLMERDIQSALFYKLCSKIGAEGYIMFGKKSQRQKWSEYELLALSTIAKIFELSVYQ